VTLAVCLISPSRLVPRRGQRPAEVVLGETIELPDQRVAGPVKVGADDVVGGHAQLLCAAAVAADRVAADPISMPDRTHHARRMSAGAHQRPADTPEHRHAEWKGVRI